MQLIHGDCLDVMPTIPNASVDLILCDLPYGTTQCSWDSVIPFESLWREYWRLLKPNGVVALTASQPFTAALLMSQPKAFRVEWIWQKNAGSNFAQMKTRPMKEHESILIFARGQCTYNPQMQERALSGAARVTMPVKSSVKRRQIAYGQNMTDDTVKMHNILRYPSSVQKINRERGLHPTQKPVALMAYLIRTYTNPGDMVLDNCMGSGTTGVACVQEARQFIGIERDATYFKIAADRIAQVEFG